MGSCEVCMGSSRQKPCVFCASCKKTVHCICAGVPADLSKNAGIKWYCDSCRVKENNTSVDEPGSSAVLRKLNEISADIKGIQVKQNEFTTSLNFYGDKIDDFEKKLKAFESVLSKIDKVSTAVADLKNENIELKKEIDALHQVSRQDEVEITGVPEQKNEDIMKTIVTISQKINFPIELADINFCSRVQTRIVNKPKPIIVKLTSRYKKNELTAAARKYKNLKACDVGFSNSNNIIYVNDHLTLTNKKLYYDARNFCKINGYAFCWTQDCKILIRKNTTSKICHISNESDLLKLSQAS